MASSLLFSKSSDLFILRRGYIRLLLHNSSQNLEVFFKLCDNLSCLFRMLIHDLLDCSNCNILQG